MTVTAQAYPYSSFFMTALILGIRHGVDLDHLAMIDAITRRITPESRLFCFVGFFFSLGHGLIVICFSLLINIFFKNFQLPPWLNAAMVGLSISLLLVFGIFNIFSLINKDKTSKRQSHKIDLIISRVFNRLAINKPYKVMLVGGVFAFSFDTISQVALLSLNINTFFGTAFSVMLGLTFMLGMMLSDGFNGYIVSALIQKASAVSLNLAKAMTLTIGLFSTMIGLYELMQWV